MNLPLDLQFKDQSGPAQIAEPMNTLINHVELQQIVSRYLGKPQFDLGIPRFILLNHDTRRCDSQQVDGRRVGEPECFGRALGESYQLGRESLRQSEFPGRPRSTTARLYSTGWRPVCGIALLHRGRIWSGFGPLSSSDGRRVGSWTIMFEDPLAKTGSVVNPFLIDEPVCVLIEEVIERAVRRADVATGDRKGTSNLAQRLPG